MRELTRHRWLLLGLAALPLLLYARSLGNGFVNWDDGLLIVDNPWIQGLSWMNIRHAFTSYDPELYIPLTLLSYQVNYAAAGLSPWIYHLTNLILHVVNVLLLFTITMQLTRRKTVAFAAALLFAVHPLHTEAVVWAAARKDVLSTAFLFLTLASFLRYRATEKRGWHALSIVSFGLGLLSKVSILTAPLVLMMIDWRPGQISFRKSLRDALPYFGLSVIFGLISLFGKVTRSAFLYDKILIGAKAAILLLGKLIFPWNLTIFYPYTQNISLMNPDLMFAVLTVIAITGVCIWLTKWNRWPLFVWIIFLFLLAPSFQNIAKGRNELLDVYVTSDRYAYAASLGPLLLFGLFFDEIRKRWKWTAWSVLAAVCVLLSVMTYRQSLTWKDSEALFRHAVEVSPDAYIAHQNLGTIAVRRGDIDEGLREYQEVLKIRPDAVTYYNIGLIMEHEGDIPAAIEAYRKAVETSPLEEDAAERLRILTVPQK
ncbi:MAG: tetratricopeptide repeat protein [Candidatus Peribacteraceae bacterium]|nr:tetratricopeptide repeat protein [Candidatus Peribacteraceae bacterium]